MLKSATLALVAGVMLTGCSTQSTVTQPHILNTDTHPVLTPHEMHHFSPAAYFSQGHKTNWTPKSIVMSQTAYVVGKHARYQSVQTAINDAILQSHDHQPITIKIMPGRYHETIYIPQDAPAMTIYGAGEKPQDVVLTFAVDSKISPKQYKKLVNGEQRYQQGDPAWSMYQVCANTPHQTIATICSATMWSQSDRFALKNLTLENSMPDAISAGTHQRVALRTDGDQVRLENVRLLGRQDTFFVNNADRDNQYNVKRQSRVLVKDSYIEGDVDYVFGRAQAVFDHVHFHTVSSRQASSGYVFAPDTPAWLPYGFLVINSQLTCDNGFKSSPKLGRAWDQGARKTGYIPGHTSNGQLVIANSTIQRCYDLNHPWGSAATTSRPFTGTAARERNLNDQHYNRLWLYNDQLIGQ